MTTNIFERAVCIEITLSRLGTRRKVSTGAVEMPKGDIGGEEVETDRTLVHVSKDILDSPELKAIQRHHGELRSYMRGRCLPAPFKGVNLLALELVETTDKWYQAWLADDLDLRAAFGRVYPAKIREAQQRLGVLFDPRDYPPAETIDRAFGSNLRYLSVGVPGMLEQINKAIFRREVEKTEAACAEITQEINDVLYATVKELVDHMVERLTPEADGKPRVFKNTLVTNMTEFLDTFPARFGVIKQGGDPTALEQLVAQAKDVLQGVTPKTLRDSGKIRDYVRTNLEKVKQSLDAMVTTRTRLVLDEEAA